MDQATVVLIGSIITPLSTYLVLRFNAKAAAAAVEVALKAAEAKAEKEREAAREERAAAEAKADKQRAWDLEDRRLAREELKRETEIIGQHVAKRVVQAENTVAAKVLEAENRANAQRSTLLAKIEEHSEISRDTNQKMGEQSAKLEEVKVASKAAETVANHANDKLARLTEIYDKAGRRAAEDKADVVEEIKHTGEDTNVRVQEIQKKIEEVDDQVAKRASAIEQNVVQEIKDTGDDTNVRVKGIEKKVDRKADKTDA